MSSPSPVHYQIDLQSDHGGRYDAWMDDAEGHFANADESDTIGSPADAADMIAVGSYATRLTWKGSGGRSYSYCDGYVCPAGTLNVGEAVPSSAVGPTADERQKPDIAAPGAMIISSKSRDIAVCQDASQSDCTDPALITPDGRNLIESGTSMAAPHVAGVIALVLQIDPSLDQSQATDILRATARHDTQTGTASWSPEFGAGRIDALAAAEAVPSADALATPVATATSAPTATATVTPAPSVTPTATPTPAHSTATATASATPAVFRFSTLAAKVAYGSAKPEAAYSRASLAKLKVGQKVKLLLFAAFSGVAVSTPVQLRFRVSGAGATAFMDVWSDTITAADNGGWTSFSGFYTPARPGSYLFTATIFVAGKHQHKSIAFTVAAR